MSNTSLGYPWLSLAIPAHFKGHLGVTSKLNQRLTAQNRRIRAVAIVQNNSNHPEPPVTGGQPPVEFWSDPLSINRASNT